MHLPDDYTDRDSYFHAALTFLGKYSWIYNFPVTRMLVYGILDCIPPEWKPVLLSMSNQELNELPGGFVKETWPQSLRDFCYSCQTLKLTPSQIPETECVNNLPTQLCHGLTPKKQHEVTHLAALVHKECYPKGITRILDLGSGLGYLDQVLHYCYDYQVLGVESKKSHIEKAHTRQKALCTSDDKVSYLECEISANSQEEIQLAVQERLLGSTGSDDVCLVGLHTCGDLSANAASIFLKQPEIKLFIVSPCCYHRMSFSQHEGGKEEFYYFPQSRGLKKLMDDVYTDARTFLRRPFMRLASQETSEKWKQYSNEEHKEHSLNLMTRAVLYLYAHNAGIQLKKKQRRGVRKTQTYTFNSILEDILSRYDFIAEDGSSVSNAREGITFLWNQYSNVCRLGEAVTALQMTMQAVAESLVLIDKIVHFQENVGDQLSCDLVKVMNSEISPRCHTLIVRKMSSAL